MFTRRDNPKDNTRKSEIGITLLEVMLSLVITGIIVSIVLTIYISQYRLNLDVAEGSERDYSLLRAGQVIGTAIMTSEKVVWTGKELYVTYHQEGKVIKDSYYLADKDHDGINDLYREHLAVPNPVVSGLTVFNCLEVNKGLWLISISAVNHENKSTWERKVRQRICLD